MSIPLSLLASLEGITGFNREAFTAVHASGQQVVSVRFNPSKQQILPAASGLGAAATVPWSSYGFYLTERPSFTFDPFFHAGMYYVQEASSMFLEQVLKQTVDIATPLRVLDLCAAPGGKSTLLQSLISENSLLVSNEVIKSRAAILEENMIKWGAANVVITNNDPAHFARLENYFDVIVVDAPCSGSGLFRRDPAAIEEWSENNVQLCSQRQQRIIADVWPALKKDGILIYSTCSYSVAEDEAVLDWLAAHFAVEGKRLSVDDSWQITETNAHRSDLFGYRFYPDKLKGEGFFIAAVQKKDGDIFRGRKPGKGILEKLGKAEEAMVKPWLQRDIELAFFKQQEYLVAIPAGLETTIPVLQTALYIKKAGVVLGKPAGGALVPDHQLAVSTLVNKQLPSFALSRQQAIQYLRREEMMLDTSLRGWVLADYENHHLGWMKILPNRINNYYPKEWRILKQPV